MHNVQDCSRKLKKKKYKNVILNINDNGNDTEYNNDIRTNGYN